MATIVSRTRITFNRDGMLEAFSAVSGVAPSRSPKPILQNLKLIADPENGATLLATDLEVGIRRMVRGVVVEEPMSVVLPTGKLGSILRTSFDIDLTLSFDGDMITIQGERSRFTIPAEDPDLFPDVPDFTSAAYHSIAPDALRRMIRRTMFATDAESTRFALAGTLVEFTDTTMAMVGTDGRRLARMVATAESEPGMEMPGGSPVVPIKALKLIDRNLIEDAPAIHVAIQAGTAVLIRTEESVIYSRLVEGRYPRYQDVYPSRAEATIPLNVAAFRSAVEQASILTSEESRGVDFDFQPGKLVLTSKAADAGSSVVETPIEHAGDAIVITFDPRYLLDALKTLEDADEFSVELIDHKNAAVFKAGTDYSYVVMPLTRERT